MLVERWHSRKGYCRCEANGASAAVKRKTEDMSDVRWEGGLHRSEYRCTLNVSLPSALTVSVTGELKKVRTLTTLSDY